MGQGSISRCCYPGALRISHQSDERFPIPAKTASHWLFLQGNPVTTQPRRGARSISCRSDQFTGKRKNRGKKNSSTSGADSDPRPGRAPPGAGTAAGPSGDRRGGRLSFPAEPQGGTAAPGTRRHQPSGMNRAVLCRAEPSPAVPSRAASALCAAAAGSRSRVARVRARGDAPSVQGKRTCPRWCRTWGVGPCGSGLVAGMAAGEG